MELVFIGRDLENFMLNCADYLMEMRKVRNSSEKGVKVCESVAY